MLKKIVILVFIFSNINIALSQVLYSERFNTLTPTTGTNTSNNSTYLYSDVPSNMFTINSGNLIADTLTGNYPFRANGQKQKAWLTYSQNSSVDTFAVSTSWFNPVGIANSWLITPAISNITANTVLTWEAMAPDAANMDGYSVYLSTNTNANPIVSDFSVTLYSNTAENYTWQKRGVSLAAYAGQTIRIAFKNNSNNKYQLWLDDIEVKNATNAYDAGTTSFDTYKYSTPNTNNSIIANFVNNGSSTITNLTINYAIGNNPFVSETKTFSSPLEYLENRQLTFSVPFISSASGYYPVKIWVSSINGQTDQYHANDTVFGALTLSSAIPAKKVLIESYTGATYGWEPEASELLKSIAATNTNVVVATIHNADNMAITSTTALVNDYVSSFPSATIDQYSFTKNKKAAIERTSWNTYIAQRQNMIVPATVTVTNVSYNPTTQEINATVSSTFFGDVKGDYRLNLYVKENNVFGDKNDESDNGWNQYSFLYNVASSPFYQKGTLLNSNTYLLNANDFKHQFVVNEMLDGAYGASGIIPTNGATNAQTYSKTYTYTLPTAGNEFRYNADNIYLIGVLTEYNTNAQERAVLNSAEVKLNSNSETVVGVKDLTLNTLDVNVFPNPTSDVCILNYTLNESQNVSVSVYNTLGELVYIETLNASAGKTTQTLNVSHLQQGNYCIVVSFKHNSISKKLTIIK